MPYSGRPERKVDLVGSGRRGLVLRLELSGKIQQYVSQSAASYTAGVDCGASGRALGTVKTGTTLYLHLHFLDGSHSNWLECTARSTLEDAWCHENLWRASGDRAAKVSLHLQSNDRA